MGKYFQLIFLILFILFTGLFSGCSSQSRVEVPESNMRQQLALQRHLQKLNKQNEKLKQTLTEASVINIETSDAISNSSLSNEKVSELKGLLDEYKQINQQTQMALDSFEKAIQNDTEKNSSLEQMLDGFAVQCEQQQDRLNRIEETLNQNDNPKWKGDNLHIGISSQLLIGSSNISSKDFNADENYNFNGTTRTAYLTYVGDYNTSLGIKYMMLLGNLKPKKETSNGAYWDYQSEIAMLSLGYRIPSVKIFNIVPEVSFGVGKSSLKSCDNSKCNEDAYYTSNLRVLGMEIPFFYQMESSFSWGFKLSAYKLLSDSVDYINDGDKVNNYDWKTDTTVAGFGLMLGFAW